MIMMQSVIAQDDAIAQCGVRKTQLKVKGYGRDLADRDAWAASQSDPYYIHGSDRNG